VRTPRRPSPARATRSPPSPGQHTGERGRRAGPRHQPLKALIVSAPEPDHLLRVVAAAAVSRPRAPHHGPGASFHSATDPGTTAGGQRSGSGDRTASGSDAAAAACFDRGGTHQRRAGADQLIASRPVPFRGGVRRIRRRVTDTGVLGTDHPPSPEPQRRSTTQPGATHHCAGQGPARSGHTGLHRPPNHRRQKSPRSQAMPETRYRTAALPPPSNSPVTQPIK